MAVNIQAERTSQFLYELMRSRLLQIDAILQYAESNTSSSAQRYALCIFLLQSIEYTIYKVVTIQ